MRKVDHCITRIKEEPRTTLVNAEIEGLLTDYATVFEESIGLPPTRKFDYKIPLKPGAQLVNYRPYKSSFFQKREIERMVKEMLNSGIIQPSVSFFLLHL
jgi:hypothetical protein